MEVILKEDVAKLGARGEVVNVAEGYGRNYLLPKKLAIEASQGEQGRNRPDEGLLGTQAGQGEGRCRAAGQAIRRRQPAALPASPANTIIVRLGHLGRHGA